MTGGHLRAPAAGEEWPQLTEWERKAKVEQYGAAQRGVEGCGTLTAPPTGFSACLQLEIVSSRKDAALALNVTVCHR